MLIDCVILRIEINRIYWNVIFLVINIDLNVNVIRVSCIVCKRGLYLFIGYLFCVFYY